VLIIFGLASWQHGKALGEGLRELKKGATDFGDGSHAHARCYPAVSELPGRVPENDRFAACVRRHERSSGTV